MCSKAADPASDLRTRRQMDGSRQARTSVPGKTQGWLPPSLALHGGPSRRVAACRDWPRARREAPSPQTRPCEPGGGPETRPARGPGPAGLRQRRESAARPGREASSSPLRPQASRWTIGLERRGERAPFVAGPRDSSCVPPKPGGLSLGAGEQSGLSRGLFRPWHRRGGPGRQHEGSWAQFPFYHARSSEHDGVLSSDVHFSQPHPSGAAQAWPGRPARCAEVGGEGSGEKRRQRVCVSSAVPLISAARKSSGELWTVYRCLLILDERGARRGSPLWGIAHLGLLVFPSRATSGERRRSQVFGFHRPPVAIRCSSGGRSAIPQSL